jgi:uncharacterized YigZ family protein
MTDLDTYKTIEAPANGSYKEKGSKFLSFAFPVSDEKEIKTILNRLKKEHHSARHHCLAWRLGAESPVFRINDDGEPSGTAGKPIFGQIQQHDLTNILIVVVRYFGGVLLGTSRLTAAYKLSAADVMLNAVIIERIILVPLEIKFSYEAMNDLMSLLKEYELEIKTSHFDILCKATVQVRKSFVITLIEQLNKIENLKAEIILNN